MSRTDASVSVVIPTHDRAHLLPRALDSVLRQTLPPAEILVIDDGSEDETRELLSRDYRTVRRIPQEHRGVSAARNRGIRQAGGSLIAFLDSDDAWEPEKLERQLAAMSRQPALPLCHTDEIWIRRGRRVNPMKKHRKSGGWIFERCLPLCVISPSSVVIERALLDEVGLFNEELPACEDYDLWLRVTARHPVLFVDEPLVIKYGGHDDQLSKRHWGMDRFRIRAIEDLLATGTLDEQQTHAAREMLREKVAIYAAGARKRGKLAEASALESGRSS